MSTWKTKTSTNNHSSLTTQTFCHFPSPSTLAHLPIHTYIYIYILFIFLLYIGTYILRYILNLPYPYLYPLFSLLQIMLSLTPSHGWYMTYKELSLKKQMHFSYDFSFVKFLFYNIFKYYNHFHNVFSFSCSS